MKKPPLGRLCGLVAYGFKTEYRLNPYRQSRRSLACWVWVTLAAVLIAVITAALVPPSTFASILITLTGSVSSAIAGWQAAQRITASACLRVLVQVESKVLKQITPFTNGQKTS